MLVEARRLHDAVQRHELDGDQAAHAATLAQARGPVHRPRAGRRLDYRETDRDPEEVAMTDPSPLHETRVEERAPQPTVAVRIQQPMAELDLSAAFDRYRPRSVTLSPRPAARRGTAVRALSPVRTGHRRRGDRSPRRGGAGRHAGPRGRRAGRDRGLRAARWRRGPDSRPRTVLTDCPALTTRSTRVHEQPGVDDGDGPWESYLDRPDKVTDVTQLRTEIVWPLNREG